ncbi:Huntingtin [Portunus trituberculatus]|uniref:Huntingtin n=1 Tax=Portunus trituberculatus TaxID=210409 RepID=A0A5B7FFR9_PORTR|nr:Huntingtin [Portunus trituberculatus]
MSTLTTGCYEFEVREQQLASSGLDVQSCLHFLHYLYSSWLRPQSGLCASVVAEVVKSVSCLCDLFCSAAHHRWVLEALVPLHTLHPIEDHITQQYIILATCKALATLRLAKQVGSSSFRRVCNEIKDLIPATHQPVEVMIVRHPLARLASAYRDKFLNGNPIHKYNKKWRNITQSIQSWNSRFLTYWMPALISTGA